MYHSEKTKMIIGDFNWHVEKIGNGYKRHMDMV